MSRAERFALAGAVVLILLQAASVAVPALAAALEYRVGALCTAPWRLLSGHLVHINWPHALINAAAWFVVARLFARELTPARQLLVVLAASIVVSLGLAFVYPRIDWYRGFSGVLHALFFAGATAWLQQTLAARETRNPGTLWLPVALVAGGWVKVWLEQPAEGTTPFAAWLGSTTVPQAHLLGAACGTVFGLIFARARASAPSPTVGDQSE